MKCLVIGMGSAGNRHVQVLTGMGHEVRQVSHRGGFAMGDEEYAVIACQTPQHAHWLKELDNFGFIGKCLVEKPLFMNAGEAYRPPFPVYVGYQLHFHPVIQALKAELQGAEVRSAHIYAGQHISLWGGTYHTDLSKGGGVLRDYSHELDLLAWLIGHPQVVECVRTPEQDCAGLLMGADKAIVSMQFNYLDQAPRREWVINTDKGTLKADLINSTLELNKVGEVPEFGRFIQPAIETTRLMHEDIIAGGTTACTYDYGLAINCLIDSIEGGV